MLTFTNSAIEAFEEISKTNPNKDIRILIKGGACEGFTYNFILDDPKDTDTIYIFDNIKVVVDPKSMKFIIGSTIDYTNSLMNHAFKIINPNEVSVCGCGKSFNVK